MCVFLRTIASSGLHVTVDTCHIGEEPVKPVRVSQFNEARVRAKRNDTPIDKFWEVRVTKGGLDGFSVRTPARLRLISSPFGDRDRDVDDSFERAKHEIRKLNLESLPCHHQVLYAIVHEAGEITGPELHQRYEEVADEAYAGTPVYPLGKRARRDKFPKLKEYDLVNYDGPTRDRLY
nr:hypothetical protein [Halosolutus gelatinilyticus]